MTNQAPYHRLRFFYPKPYRDEHFPELAATADELSDGSWSPRQAFSLATNGLRTRARLAAESNAEGPPSGTALLAPALRLGYVLWLIAFGTGPIVAASSGLLPLGVQTRSLIVQGVLFILAAVILVWRAGRLATITVAIALSYSSIDHVLPWGPESPPAELTLLDAATLVSVLVIAAPIWWLSKNTDERERHISGVPVVVSVGLLAAVSVATGTQALLIALGAGFIVAGVVGLVVAAFDPRLLVITAIWLPWFVVGELIYSWQLGMVPIHLFIPSAIGVLGLLLARRGIATATRPIAVG